MASIYCNSACILCLTWMLCINASTTVAPTSDVSSHIPAPTKPACDVICGEPTNPVKHKYTPGSCTTNGDTTICYYTDHHVDCLVNETQSANNTFHCRCHNYYLWSNGRCLHQNFIIGPAGAGGALLLVIIIILIVFLVLKTRALKEKEREIKHRDDIELQQLRDAAKGSIGDTSDLLGRDPIEVALYQNGHLKNQDGKDERKPHSQEIDNPAYARDPRDPERPQEDTNATTDKRRSQADAPGRTGDELDKGINPKDRSAETRQQQGQERDSKTDDLNRRMIERGADPWKDYRKDNPYAGDRDREDERRLSDRDDDMWRDYQQEAYKENQKYMDELNKNLAQRNSEPPRNYNQGDDNERGRDRHSKDKSRRRDHRRMRDDGDELPERRRDERRDHYNRPRDSDSKPRRERDRRDQFIDEPPMDYDRKPSKYASDKYNDYGRHKRSSDIRDDATGRRGDDDVRYPATDYQQDYHKEKRGRSSQNDGLDADRDYPERSRNGREHDYKDIDRGYGSNEGGQGQGRNKLEGEVVYNHYADRDTSKQFDFQRHSAFQPTPFADAQRKDSNYESRWSSGADGRI